MENFWARTVFFVKDAEHARRFYTQSLGFGLDWSHEEHGHAFVFQVSLFGFQLILNQVQAEAGTLDRPGHGRVFIGLDEEQVGPFRRHLAEKRISTTLVQWGAPTLVIHDLDGNELFFWSPDGERASLEAGPAGA